MKANSVEPFYGCLEWKVLSEVMIQTPLF